LFPVQGGMWTGYSQSTYLPALETIHDMVPHHSEEWNTHNFNT